MAQLHPLAPLLPLAKLLALGLALELVPEPEAPQTLAAAFAVVYEVLML
jgi:hypothetical protein